MRAAESFAARYIIRRGRCSAPKRNLSETQCRSRWGLRRLHNRCCILREGRMSWCGRRGLYLRSEMAHRQADAVNLDFNADFCVLHPLLGRQLPPLAAYVAAPLVSIKCIVNLAERIHPLTFTEPAQGGSLVNL